MSNSESEITYDKFVISDRFCIVFNLSMYTIYDIVAHREVKSFEHRGGYNHTNCPAKLYVENLIEYKNNTFFLHHKDKTDVYVLSDKEIVAKDTECVICFGHTNKYLALYPCGHARYCESCIDKFNPPSVPFVIHKFNL